MLDFLNGKSLAEVKFAVVDTETTGLSGSNDYVLQLGVVVARGDGTIEDQFVTFVKRFFWKPGRLGAYKVHGIKRSDLQRGLKPEEMLGRLESFLRDSIFVAHNAKFDIGFLKGEADRLEKTFNFNGPLDTLKLSRALDPKRVNSHRLGDVTKRYGVVVARQHDALADALGAAMVLPRLLEQHGVTTVEQLSSHFGV
ncbi:MAG: PolC-type DNA polymerase III [Actinomycetota bacterium]